MIQTRDPNHNPERINALDRSAMAPLSFDLLFANRKQNIFKMIFYSFQFLKFDEISNKNIHP